jgi:hypothetical protein
MHQTAMTRQACQELGGKNTSNQFFVVKATIIIFYGKKKKEAGIKETCD